MSKANKNYHRALNFEKISALGKFAQLNDLYNMMISKISEFVKTHLNNIILAVMVMLFVLLSFAAGYIIAKYQDREPIQIYPVK